MNIRVNLCRVPILACAVLLAIAIGSSAIGAEASGCVVSQLGGGDTVIDISRGHSCDESAPSDAARGRPGMRLLEF